MYTENNYSICYVNHRSMLKMFYDMLDTKVTVFKYTLDSLKEMSNRPIPPAKIRFTK